MPCAARHGGLREPFGERGVALVGMPCVKIDPDTWPDVCEVAVSSADKEVCRSVAYDAVVDPDMVDLVGWLHLRRTVDVHGAKPCKTPAHARFELVQMVAQQTVQQSSGIFVASWRDVHQHGVAFGMLREIAENAGEAVAPRLVRRV